MKIYKFKNVKHSVIMVFVMMNKDGEWILLYTAKPEDLEEVKDDRD